LVGARSTDESAEDCRYEDGLSKAHVDPFCSGDTKNVPADALVATQYVTGQTDWRREALMLMRVRQKCNRDASVHRVAPRVPPIAHIGDENCVQIWDLPRNPWLTAKAPDDRVQQLHDS
jgi:hypothetical protein